MLRDFDSTLRLTHEPTGISVEWRGWRGKVSMRERREQLRRLLRSKVAAHRRGERIDLRGLVIEEIEPIEEAQS